MTIRETLQNAKPTQWLMITDAPRAHYLMSGIQRAGIRADGLVKVRYEDGTEKESQAPDAMLDAEADSLTLLTFASHFSP